MRILRCLSSVLMLCFLLAGCAGASRNMVEKFFTDIAEGEEYAAVGRFSPALHAQFGPDMLKEAVARWGRTIRAHGGLERVKVRGPFAIFTDLALYDVTLVFADGSRRVLKTSTIRIEGVWYINAAL